MARWRELAQTRWFGADYNAEVKKMDVELKKGWSMLVAQHMRLAEHIVILVDIYGKSFLHTLILYQCPLKFQAHCVKYRFLIADARYRASYFFLIHHLVSDT